MVSCERELGVDAFGNKGIDPFLLPAPAGCINRNSLFPMQPNEYKSDNIGGTTHDSYFEKAC
ncbi:MAG: hypothetical protein ACLSAP_12660, partial [Oscillospiraceae bacterium]